MISPIRCASSAIEALPLILIETEPQTNIPRETRGTS